MGDGDGRRRLGDPFVYQWYDLPGLPQTTHELHQVLTLVTSNGDPWNHGTTKP